MIRNINIDLQYQNTIEGPPQAQGNLFDKACSSDAVTLKTWREIWIKHTKANKERFKTMSDYSIGKLYGINKYKPVIVLGSGPSLKSSIDVLKENAISDSPVMTVSCLHNFGYFEDEGFHADYYVSLDAGEIVFQDVSEGRKEIPEYYWEKTKDKTLLATYLSDPRLFEKWQGKVYLFSVMMPDLQLQTEIQSIEPFKHYVSCGGNAAGACFYIAQMIFCSHVTHFVGTDFCFDYDSTFHSYKTHYDNIGTYVLATDIFGNKRKTWPSYMNFKYWFDHIACTVPGRYVNCSEGLLGAYPEGNIRQFQYMSLKDALVPYRTMDRVTVNKIDANTNQITENKQLKLKEFFANPQWEQDLALF